ncbi:hypothetical protein BDQ17DRAFT_1419734 [Cyathus striatus]|nr:hypothetical protein BDQ17DRAFT_1419734 [Cyathus striatus]
MSEIFPLVVVVVDISLGLLHLNGVAGPSLSRKVGARGRVNLSSLRFSGDSRGTSRGSSSSRLNGKYSAKALGGSSNVGDSKISDVEGKGVSGGGVPGLWGNSVTSCPGPPSPAEETSPRALIHEIGLVDSTDEHHFVEKIVHLSDSCNSDNDIVTSVASEWSTVNNRKKKSSENLRDKTKAVPPVLHGQPPHFSANQRATIKLAKKNLTEHERDHIAKRDQAVRFNGSQESSPSAIAGPSVQKGKGPDPSNWGGAGLDESEVDIDAQRAAYESFKQSRSSHTAATSTVEDVHDTPKSSKKNKKSKENPHTTSVSQTGIFPPIARKRRGKEQLRFNLEPINQVPHNSQLGQAFHHHRCDPSDPDDSSSSSSSSSGNSGGSGGNHSSSTSDLSSSNSDNGHDSPESDETKSMGKCSKEKKKHHGHHGKRSKRSKSHRPRSSIKIPPPKEYDGAPEARTFRQFMDETMAYISHGHLSKKSHIFVLSYYLKGKAAEFYEQRVANTHSKWTLDKFFTAMFNFIFPPDY